MGNDKWTSLSGARLEVISCLPVVHILGSDAFMLSADECSINGAHAPVPLTYVEVMHLLSLLVNGVIIAHFLLPFHVTYVVSPGTWSLTGYLAPNFPPTPLCMSTPLPLIRRSARRLERMPQGAARPR